MQYFLSPVGAGLLMSISHIAFGVQVPITSFNAIIRAETAFFVLFYGLLIPIVGVTSQVYRFRYVSSDAERQ